MTSSLRAGVIGAGVFGGYHAAKWAAFEGVSLTAIHDPHLERAAKLALIHGAEPFADLAVFLEQVDLVSIASPAATHGRLALAALKAGKHVYVEKPVTIDPREADAIVGEASRRGLIAACGLLERAAFRAIGLLTAPERPRRLEAVRLGKPSPRNLDVSVVLDLMIHDLDLALAIGAGQPFAVEAEGARMVNDLHDEVTADVTFEDGFCATFRASRVATTPERTMRIVYPSGVVSIDFLSGAFQNATAFPLDAGFADTPDGRDRLGASLLEFLRATRGETARPLADAIDGARALDLALAVEQAASE
jgi:predicted dehydrogenase